MCRFERKEECAGAIRNEIKSPHENGSASVCAFADFVIARRREQEAMTLSDSPGRARKSFLDEGCTRELRVFSRIVCNVDRKRAFESCLLILRYGVMFNDTFYHLLLLSFQVIMIDCPHRLCTEKIIKSDALRDIGSSLFLYYCNYDE